MSEVEKALSTWERFQKFSRRSLWKIACGVLALGLIVTYCVYARAQASSPMRYCRMLYDVFSTEWIFLEGEEACVDFTQSGIADQLELQQETCEQLTSALGHTFHIDEQAPEPHFFPGVSVTIRDMGRGSYSIDMIAPRMQMVDGKLDYCLDRGYMCGYRYDPFVLRWRVIWPQ